MRQGQNINCCLQPVGKTKYLAFTRSIVFEAAANQGVTATSFIRELKGLEKYPYYDLAPDQLVWNGFQTIRVINPVKGTAECCQTGKPSDTLREF